MGTTIDPAGKEIQALFDAVESAGARVLEIGSGDGRLALRYARVARSVVGLESGADAVRTAVGACSSAGRRPRFVRGSGVKLPFGAAAFDIALFGWSL